MTDIALLDGGLGLEIQKRSMTNAHPLWSVKVMFDQPDIVTKVHHDFIKSGAGVICLNTYTGAQSRMTLHCHHLLALKLFQNMARGLTPIMPYHYSYEYP